MKRLLSKWFSAVIGILLAFASTAFAATHPMFVTTSAFSAKTLTISDGMPLGRSGVEGSNTCGPRTNPSESFCGNRPRGRQHYQVCSKSPAGHSRAANAFFWNT